MLYYSRHVSTLAVSMLVVFRLDTGLWFVFVQCMPWGLKLRVIGYCQAWANITRCHSIVSLPPFSTNIVRPSTIIRISCVTISISLYGSIGVFVPPPYCPCMAAWLHPWGVPGSARPARLGPPVLRTWVRPCCVPLAAVAVSGPAPWRPSVLALCAGLQSPAPAASAGASG